MTFCKSHSGYICGKIEEARNSVKFHTAFYDTLQFLVIIVSIQCMLGFIKSYAFKMLYKYVMHKSKLPE